MQPLCLGARYLVEVHAIAPRACRLNAQLMFARLGLRQIQRTGLEDAATLTCLGLERLVQLHRVMLDAADVGDVMQPVDIGGRMPCRSRGQFGPFQQDRIGPALLRQMVEDRTAHKPAADHDGRGMAWQGLCRGIWRGRGHGSSCPMSCLRLAT